MLNVRSVPKDNFVVKMAYFLPLSRKIGLAVRFEYYPAPIFLAEHCKSTILTTKYGGILIELKVVKLKNLVTYFV